MLIILSLFFLVVWLVFLKLKWLPFNRTWKIIIWTTAFVICLVVLGALQYYTPMSRAAVVEAPTQRIYRESDQRLGEGPDVDLGLGELCFLRT